MARRPLPGCRRQDAAQARSFLPILLAATMAAAAAWPGTAGATKLSVPYFSQCDAAWGSQQLGTCNLTLCQAGCAVTSLAMLFQYYGGSRDPGELDVCLTNQGGYSGGCSLIWDNPCMPSGVTFNGWENDLSVIRRELEAGRPVVAQVHASYTSMHFVLIVGNDLNEYQINDPGWGYETMSAGGFVIDSLRLYSGTPAVTCEKVLTSSRRTVIDDKGPCFKRYSVWWWKEPTGFRGSHWWTYANDDSRHDCWAKWIFTVQDPGRYKVEVYIPETMADSTSARYVVRASGRRHQVFFDQTAGTGWQELGRYDFEAGDDQFVALHDNTGEPLANHIPIAFDAIRFTWAPDEPEPDASVPEPDASVPDGAVTDDGGSDAKPRDARPDEHDARVGDASAAGDGGEQDVSLQSGCGCRNTPAGTGAPASLPIGILVGLALGRRRRKRREVGR